MRKLMLCFLLCIALFAAVPAALGEEAPVFSQPAETASAEPQDSAAPTEAPAPEPAAPPAQESEQPPASAMPTPESSQTPKPESSAAPAETPDPALPPHEPLLPKESEAPQATPTASPSGIATMVVRTPSPVFSYLPGAVTPTATRPAYEGNPIPETDARTIAEETLYARYGDCLAGLAMSAELTEEDDGIFEPPYYQFDYYTDGELRYSCYVHAYTQEVMYVGDPSSIGALQGTPTPAPAAAPAGTVE